ncbi:MAG: FGGY-family carbohydrate kinase [Pseudomonadota bacterium]
MTLSLGIDVGTSGVRTAVIDATGMPVSEARAAHLPNDPKRIDATKWWTSVQNCIAKQVENLKVSGLSGEDISRIAVDGTSGSMVLTDGDLRPVSPALMYNSKGFDAEAAAIARCAPATHITRGGNSALGRAMRLASLADGTPRHLLHQADYIAAKLLGEGGRSDFNNALKTGFDPADTAWPDWADEVLDPNLLPTVSPPGMAWERVSKSVADDLGVSDTAIIHAGTTDSIAAFLACAPLERANAVTSLGSTLAIKVLSANRVDDPSIGLYSHRISGHWLVGGASNTGGAVLAKHFSSDELAKLSAQIEPTKSLDLDYYPLNQPGERFPINDPNLEPKLTPRPDSDVEFLHAMLSAIARIEALGYAEIERRGGETPARIFTAGGGAKNTTWTKIRGQYVHSEICVAENTEASIGTAKLTSIGPE